MKKSGKYDDLEKLKKLLSETLDQIELVQNSDILNNDGNKNKLIILPTSNSNTESEILILLREYISTYYTKTAYGRIPATIFHSSVSEFFKESKKVIEIRYIPIFMVHVLGFKRVKSHGEWVYEGILPNKLDQ